LGLIAAKSECGGVGEGAGLEVCHNATLSVVAADAEAVAA
jgi:hypothetical protein